ncbi:MAG TPA: helix-turn-helix domain-containing protein [Acidimicrobiales bacterium]|jgi:AcrR family transcriptional regulator
MARTRLTRDESKAVTLSRILLAADTVFEHKGFVAASVDEIADEAGYSKGAVYANFPTKQALFLAVAGQRMRDTGAELFSAIRAATTPVELVGNVNDWFRARRRTTIDRFALNIEFWMIMARDPKLREIGGRSFQMARSRTAEIVSEQVERHALRPNLSPESIATIMIALRSGIETQEWFDPGGISETIVGDLLEVLLGLPQVNSLPISAELHAPP